MWSVFNEEFAEQGLPVNTTDDDGYFWIEWKDVLRTGTFSHIYILWNKDRLICKKRFTNLTYDADYDDACNCLGSSPQFLLNAKRGRKYYFVVSRVKNSTLSSSYIAAHAYKLRNPREDGISGKNRLGKHLKESKRDRNRPSSGKNNINAESDHHKIRSSRRKEKKRRQGGSSSSSHHGNEGWHQADLPKSPEVELGNFGGSSSSTATTISKNDINPNRSYITLGNGQVTVGPPIIEDEGINCCDVEENPLIASSMFPTYGNCSDTTLPLNNTTSYEEIDKSESDLQFPKEGCHMGHSDDDNNLDPVFQKGQYADIRADIADAPPGMGNGVLEIFGVGESPSRSPSPVRRHPTTNFSGAPTGLGPNGETIFNGFGSARDLVPTSGSQFVGTTTAFY